MTTKQYLTLTQHPYTDYDSFSFTVKGDNYSLSLSNIVSDRCESAINKEAMRAVDTQSGFQIVINKKKIFLDYAEIHELSLFLNLLLKETQQAFKIVQVEEIKS